MVKMILGQKVTLGKKYIAPSNSAVLSYLKSAQKGKGLAKKILLKNKKSK